MMTRLEPLDYPEPSGQNIAYLHQMLGQLRNVAYEEGAEMLCYLIEMAVVEAADLQKGRQPLSIKRHIVSQN